MASAASGPDIGLKSQQLAKEFIARGIHLAFGIPGSGPILNFVDAFVKAGGQLILSRHEASAAIMAGLVGKRQRNPAIVFCADGTARMNLLAGLSHCWFEKYPVIALWDSATDSPPHQKLQRLPDHDFSPFFNTCLEGLGDNIAETVRFLRAACHAPDEGPVGLPLRNDDRCLPALPTVPPAARSGQILSPVAGRPVIIVGTAACQHSEVETLKRCVRELRVPWLTTIGAKGFLPENDPFSMRVFTGVGSSRTPEAAILDRADVVIGIGLRHSDVIKVRPFSKPTILLDTDRPEESTGFAAEQYLAPSFKAIPGLVASFINETSERWSREECSAIIENSRTQILSPSNEAGSICESMSRLLFGEATVVVDDGIFQKHSEYFWLTKDARDYVGTATGRNMGSAIPAAVALAMVEPDRPVVCLAGDGGLPMYLSELSLLSEHRCGKMLVVHFADFSLGSMRAVLGQKQLLGSDRAMDVKSSYMQVLSAFGFSSLAADSVAAIDRCVREWRRDSGNLFIEYRLDRDRYPETLSLIR